MSLVAVTPFLWPGPPIGMEDTGLGGTVQALLDANGEKGAWVFAVPKAGQISKVGFRVGSVVADTVDVRVETLGTDARPSTTLRSTNSNFSWVLVGTEDNNWHWLTLTANAGSSNGELVVGEYLAVVVAQDSANAFNLVLGSTNMGDVEGVPSSMTNIGGWGDQPTSCPILAVEYSDGSRPFIGTFPANSFGSLQAVDDQGTNPDEYGLRFKVPFACKITGFRHRAYSTAAILYDAKLYEYAPDGTTLIQTMVNKTGIDVEMDYGIAGPLVTVLFDEVTLVPGNVYRMVLKATAGENSDLNVPIFQVESAGTMEAISGGVELYATERLDGGTWTDTVTERPFMALMISALDNGTPAVDINTPNIIVPRGMVGY